MYSDFEPSQGKIKMFKKSFCDILGLSAERLFTLL